MKPTQGKGVCAEPEWLHLHQTKQNLQKNTRNQEGYVIIKGSFHQEYVTIIIVHTPRNRLKIGKEKADDRTTRRDISQGISPFPSDPTVGEDPPPPPTAAYAFCSEHPAERSPGQKRKDRKSKSQ